MRVWSFSQAEANSSFKRVYASAKEMEKEMLKTYEAKKKWVDYSVKTLRFNKLC